VIFDERFWVARRKASLVAAVCLGWLAGCSQKPKYDVTILEGGAATRFGVTTAFAEYVELPGSRNELHLTLAGYAASCDAWVPPKPGESAVTVTIVLPPNVRPAVASYAWTGIPNDEEPLKAPYALPKALFGASSRLFEPGGLVRLSTVDLDPHGAVSGTLAFEYPGDADHPATRIDGGFEARLCRIQLAPR
jgi:hypothetical protein